MREYLYRRKERRTRTGYDTRVGSWIKTKEEAGERAREAGRRGGWWWWWWGERSVTRAPDYKYVDFLWLTVPVSAAS